MISSKEELQQRISEALDSFLSAQKTLPCNKCKENDSMYQSFKLYFPDFPVTANISDQLAFIEAKFKEKNSFSPSFITQEAEHTDGFKEELSKLRLENERLKTELTKKSEKWRKIKEILQNRESVKRKLGCLLDEDYENLSPESNDNDNNSGLSSAQNSQNDIDKIDLLAKLSEKNQDTEHEMKSSKIRKTPLKEDKNITAGSAKKHNQDCPCCTKFYEAIKGSDEDLLPRKNLISRHKYRDAMPETPPGFWAVGFTQE